MATTSSSTTRSLDARRKRVDAMAAQAAARADRMDEGQNEPALDLEAMAEDDDAADDAILAAAEVDPEPRVPAARRCSRGSSAVSLWPSPSLRRPTKS